MGDYGSARVRGCIPADFELLFPRHWGRKGKAAAKDRHWFLISCNPARGWLTCGKSEWLDSVADVVDVTGATIVAAGGELQIAAPGIDPFMVGFDDVNVAREFAVQLKNAAGRCAF